MWFVNHRPSGQEFRVGHPWDLHNSAGRLATRASLSQECCSALVLGWGLRDAKRRFEIPTNRKFGDKHEFGAFHSSKTQLRLKLFLNSIGLPDSVLISVPLICYTDFRKNYQQVCSFFWGDEQRTQFKRGETLKHMATVWHRSALLNWFAK